MPVVREIVHLEEGIHRYVLSNKAGTLHAKILNYGATLTHLITPDKDGKDRDVVLGFDDVDGYKGPDNRYLGATVGRFANRIAGGTFKLNGRKYQLDVNNGPNALHGGVHGFDKRLWEVEVVPVDTHPAAITCKLTSPDGDQGYPGEVAVEVTYLVEEEGALKITYHAHLKGKQLETVVNLTNHSYFNLSGGVDDTVLEHEVMLDADRVLVKDADNVPTGELQPVQDAPQFDFTRPRAIGELMDRLDPKTGYDHCYVVRGVDVAAEDVGAKEAPRLAARVTCPSTGITLEFLTTEPGFQFYTAYFLSGSARSKKSSQPDFAYGPYSAFCLEAQRFPDAPNHEQWRHMAVLKPGQEYKQTTVYRLSAANKRAKTDKE